jgi:hypothetical protein
MRVRIPLNHIKKIEVEHVEKFLYWFQITPLL